MKNVKKYIETTEDKSVLTETEGFFPQRETITTSKIENNKSDTLLNLKNELLNSFHEEITDYINRGYSHREENRKILNKKMMELHGVTIPEELLFCGEDLDLGNLLVMIRRGVDRLDHLFDVLIDLYSTEVVYN